MTGRLLTWRSLWLAAVALVLMGAMVALGFWQLSVYDAHQHDNAKAQLERPPVALNDVIGADDAFPSDGVSRPVTLTGRYLPDEQFTVHNGPTLGVADAVVAPLVVADGSAVLVVRGHGREGAPPPGDVRLSGVLEPSDVTGTSLDSDRVTDGLRTAALVQNFDQDLYAGYVVLTSSNPADTLEPIPPPTPGASRWAGLRNLLYAVQWWLFAGFVGFMWWRVVTEPPGGIPGDGEDSRSHGDTAASSPTSVG